MEIQVGQLARTKGSTFAVREYGDRLARDHQQADAMVQAFARAHNITLESEPSPAAPQNLESQSGVQFDQSFLRQMESGHRSAVSMLGTAHRTFLGQPLGTLIGKLIPILEQHYVIASTLDIRTVAKNGASPGALRGGE